MKKFMYFLSKGTRSQQNFYNLYDTSVSDNINNHFNETNIFKYHALDPDLYDSSGLHSGILLDQRFTDINNSQKYLAQCLSSSDSSTSAVTDLLDFIPTNDLPVTKTNVDSDSSAIKMEEEEEEDCKLEKKNKVKKNICFINISNSKYFHIGSQNTININERPFMRKTVEDSGAHLLKKNYSHLRFDFQNLLDCQERVAEKYILLISLHVNELWREFLRNLGLEKTTLETLESRNNNNRILSVYDALHIYINLFPNTSLGFVIHVLKEIHQIVAIEKLAQELNI